MAENPKYDILLRGGRVICPASGIDGIRDVQHAAERLLQPEFCLRGGKRFDARSPILPQGIAA